MVATIALPCIALSACGDDISKRAPVVSDVAVTTMEDTAAPVVVPLTATDPSAVTLTITTGPSHGSVTGQGPTWTYMPASNYNGPDSFVVKAADGHGSSTATATITVTPVDDRPIAVDDTASVGESAQPSMIDVLANDTDVDGGPRTIASVTQPAHGSASVVAGGTAIMYSSGVGYCNLVPNAAADTFTYTLSPGGATATVSVKVSCACGLKKTTDFVVGNP
jgi:VCBS repeat-containing protein